MIFQNVTIGSNKGDGKQGIPRIGNNVLIGAGAVLVGDIRVGDNAVIGANSVVLTDVPANAVVAGVPAIVKRYRNPP